MGGPRLSAPVQLKTGRRKHPNICSELALGRTTSEITAPRTETHNLEEDILPKITTTKSQSVPAMQSNLASKILTLKNRISEHKKDIEGHQEGAATLASATCNGDDVKMTSVQSEPPAAAPGLDELHVLDFWERSSPSPLSEGAALGEDLNRSTEPPGKTPLPPSVIEDGVLTLQVDDEDDDFLVMRD
ncbi:uncharacterized protein V6R79_023061 [Siganus canaliculatus]